MIVSKTETVIRSKIYLTNPGDCETYKRAMNHDLDEFGKVFKNLKKKLNNLYAPNKYKKLMPAKLK